MSQRAVQDKILGFFRDNLVVTIVSALALVAALTLAGAYHPPESVNLNSQHISRFQVASEAKGTITANATQLQLKGATGTVDMVLPAPVSACPQVAAAFHATCNAGGFTMAPPLTADWGAVAQDFVVPGVSGDKVALTTRPAQLGGGIQLTVSGGPPPRICLRHDARAGALTLRSIDAVASIPVAIAVAPLCEGVVVTVASNAGGPSGLTFQGMTSAQAEFEGHQLTVLAESSTLTLRSTAQDIALRGEVEIDSNGPFEVTADWVSPDFTTDQGIQAYATSATNAGAERLDSVLTRYPWSSEIGTVAVAVAIFALGLLAKLILKLVAPKKAKPKPQMPEAARQ